MGTGRAYTRLGETRLFFPFIFPASTRLSQVLAEPEEWQGLCGLKNIIFSRSMRNVSLEYHMTHGQRDRLNMDRKSPDDDEVRREETSQSKY